MVDKVKPDFSRQGEGGIANPEWVKPLRHWDFAMVIRLVGSNFFSLLPLFLGAMICCAAAGQGSAQQDAAQPMFVERLQAIGTVPTGWTVLRDTYVASPDSTRVAMKVTRDDHGRTQTVAVDNVLMGPKGKVIFGPIFSPDSTRAAMVVSQGGTGILQVGNARMVGPDPIAAPVISPDGQRIAYVGREGQRQLVYVDGRSSVVYDQVMVDSLTFSADSAQFAYIAKRGPGTFVVLNGHEGTAYSQIASLVFSPDSQRLAYWAGQPDRGWTVVADGLENTLMRVQDQAGLQFSPDSSKLAGFGQRNGRWHLIVDGRFGHGHDALGRGSLTFSPDSQHIVYAAVNDRQWSVVLDGTTVGEFGALLAGSIMFSPDSARLAYVARDDQGWFVVLDNRRDRSFDHVTSQSLQFSPDSHRFAYVAKNDTERVSVIVDGYRWGICDGVEVLTFSPDSASVVWVERRGQASHVVVDGIHGSYRFDQMVPGASLVFDGNIDFHTVVYGLPGPVFFRYHARLYPPDGDLDHQEDFRVLPTQDRIID